MAYRFAITRENHEDLSAGGALFSAPGFPAFPVRLASEMFQRAMASRASGAPALVWDPCCGSAYLLTVLALLHRDRMTGVIGTDLDDRALGLARRNLGLLAPGGLSVRSAELRERQARFGKPSYARAAEAALRLDDRLTALGGPLPRAVAHADVMDPEWLRGVLDGRKPDVVIADVPYGEQTEWSGIHADGGLAGMLRSVSSVLDDDAVIAIATRGRRVLVGEAHPRIETFRVGTRAVALFRASSPTP